MVEGFEEYTKPLEGAIIVSLSKAIIGVLKGSHTGRNRAITASAFAKLLTEFTGREITVRMLRHAISMLRMKGEPICSWGRGYYYMSNDIEMNSTIQSLTDRMIALAAQVAALSAKYAELYGNRPVLNFKDLKENIEYLLPIEDED